MRRDLSTGLVGAFALLLAMIGAAAAATIEVKPLPGGGSLIFVDGTFELGDEKTFANAAVPLDGGTVAFSSPGGNLRAGIEIGRAIRLKGFNTYVADRQSCASACAFAWLGGRERLMSSSAHVGFHGAYLEKDGQKTTTSIGNALVGAYLSQLGMPESAVAYVVAAGPDEIRWLSFSDARDIGIDVKRLDLADTAGPSRAAPASGAPSVVPGMPSQAGPSGRWRAAGEWIQLYSRPTQAEAEALAASLRGRFDDASVFRFVNGWYAVVLGPYPAGSALPRRDALLATGAIPSDSILANPDRMAEPVAGAMLSRPASRSAGGAPLEAQARAFFLSFLAEWSQDNAAAVSALDSVYADQLTYYGKAATHAAVMQEKRQFAERWPRRFYVAQPDSLTVGCLPESGECTVGGLIAWRAESPARNATSVGTAQYEFQLRFLGGRAVIVGERGTILSRSASR